MESAQSQYEKKMMEEAKKQYTIINLDKLKNRDKPFLFNSSLHKPKRDVTLP